MISTTTIISSFQALFFVVVVVSIFRRFCCWRWSNIKQKIDILFINISSFLDNIVINTLFFVVEICWNILFVISRILPRFTTKTTTRDRWSCFLVCRRIFRWTQLLFYRIYNLNFRFFVVSLIRNKQRRKNSKKVSTWLSIVFGYNYCNN